MKEEFDKLVATRMKLEADLRTEFCQEEIELMCHIEDKKADTLRRIDNINKKSMVDIDAAETEWRKQATQWLSNANRKIHNKAMHEREKGR